jgi:hypothetical protein
LAGSGFPFMNSPGQLILFNNLIKIIYRSHLEITSIVGTSYFPLCSMQRIYHTLERDKPMLPSRG